MSLWQDNSQYEATTDVRGQLKVLESIDKIIDSRRQEREKEKILKAATSRSKQDNPELAKKKEQAKQVIKAGRNLFTVLFVCICKSSLFFD